MEVQVFFVKCKGLLSLYLVLSGYVLFCSSQAATTVTKYTDHLINGLQCADIPHICDDFHGQTICSNYCHGVGTGGIPTASVNAHCVDHVANNLTCSDVPSVCKDPFAKRLCPKFCKLCDIESSVSSLTPSTMATLAPTPSSVADPCADNVISGISCESVPNICTDIYGHLICPGYCSGNCGSTAGILPLVIPPSGPCEDHVSGRYTCQRLPGVCTDSIANVFCPKHCGLCSSSCVDHLINGRHCQHIARICQTDYGPTLCARYCNLCSGPTVAPVADTTAAPGSCVDFIGNGLTCQDLGPHICNDSTQVGPKLLCPKFCHQCQEPPLDTCQDFLVYHLTCADIQGICQSQFSFVCRRTCQMCNGIGRVRPAQSPPQEVCYDHVGGGLLCSEIPGICLNTQLASRICPRHCHLCDLTTTPRPTTAALTSTPRPIPSAATTAVSAMLECEDNVGLGIHCTTSLCGLDYAYIICPKFCGFCEARLGLHSQCIDNVANGLSCQELKEDSFCGDPYSKLFCKLTCGHCVVSATTEKPTTMTPTTQPTTATTPTTEPTTAMTPTTEPTTATTPTTEPTTATTPTTEPTTATTPTTEPTTATTPTTEPTTATTPTTEPTTATTPTTEPTTATTPTTEPTTATTPTTEPTTATTPTTEPTTATTPTTEPTTATTPTTEPTTATTPTTEPTTTTPTTQPTTATTPTTEPTTTTPTTQPTTTTIAKPCADANAFGSLTCQDLNETTDVCSDSAGRAFCPRFCGVCTDCKPLPTANICFDQAEFEVCNIPFFCDNPYAKVACQKTCEFCDPGCIDRFLKSGSKCTDLFGPGRALSGLEELCSDHLGAEVCELTCGCPGYCH